MTYHGSPTWLAEPRQIDEARAEILKVNNSAAEHFLYYDSPPWAQPYRPVLDQPDYIKERIAEREAELARLKSAPTSD